MTEETKKYIISFPLPKGSKKGAKKKTFFELAKRHIVKIKPGDDPDLSKKIDEVVYGI